MSNTQNIIEIINENVHTKIKIHNKVWFNSALVWKEHTALIKQKK